MRVGFRLAGSSLGYIFNYEHGTHFHDFPGNFPGKPKIMGFPGEFPEKTRKSWVFPGNFPRNTENHGFSREISRLEHVLQRSYK